MNLLFRIQSQYISLILKLFLIISILTGCVDLRNAQIEGLDGAFFGDSISVNGSRVLIGAIGGTGDGTLRGVSYVFNRSSDGWSQEAKLSTEGGNKLQGYDYFGGAVSLFESTALVGAWAANPIAPVSGSAFIFERESTGWHQSAVLINPDAKERYLLGESVALDGNTAVVGAPGANQKLVRGYSKPIPRWSGNVYIWIREGAEWQYQAKITPDVLSLPPTQSTESYKPYYLAKNFGEEVVIQNDTIVVSAHEGTVTPGKVYIFRRHDNVWKQEARLEEKQDYFATSIAISNETVAVASANAIFIYSRVNDDWRLQSKIQPYVESKKTGFQYGGSISIDGDILVAGATRYNDRKGAAFVFERIENEWKQVSMLTGHDTKSDRLFSGAVGDLFGRDVSIYGKTIVIGASFHDAEGSNNGAAYVFKKEGAQWIQRAKLTAQVNNLEAPK